MKTKITVIVIVLAITFVVTSLCPRPVAWPLGSELVKPGLCVYDVEKIKHKMSYHGTLVVKRDLTIGEWYFWRKGRRCRLR